MLTDKIIKMVEQEKIIAIVRGIAPDRCLKVADALYEGGIRLMEITFNSNAPESFQTTANCISEISKKYKGKMLVGAGTVMNPQQVEMTAEAGGCYIISPDVNPDVICRTTELGMVSMPGAFTPTEIAVAHKAGAHFVKIFPAGIIGPDYIKSVMAPISNVKLLAVGGINAENLGSFLQAGVVGAGIGGNLANKVWIEAGEYYKITETARSLVSIAKMG